MTSFRSKWIALGNYFESASRASLLLFLGAYRTVLTSHLGGSCRFEPSCSQYAVEAVKLHSPLAALTLVTKRLISCRPGGPYGFDPVPLPQERSKT